MFRRKTVAVTSVFILILLVTTVTFGQVGNNTSVLNPNLAGEKELTEVPHINAELAKSVTENRPYLNLTELNELLSKSLKEEQLSDIYVKLFVPINLNIASDEEILMVPGVGNRMQHEFDEYRPYRALIQFRREIGKYVDDEELARLEQYVFVPIKLNTASDEDILSIPGVGNRMLHEFKEYRPYRSIEQFRREIGKYVNDDELARLERYVILK
jgi:DNA uptake protein ComE-like DNA-binding protein